MVGAMVFALTPPSASANSIFNVFVTRPTNLILTSRPLFFTGLNKQSSNSNSKNRMPDIALAIRGGQSAVNRTVKDNGKESKGAGRLVTSQGRDEDEKYGPVCPGCGVYMQDRDPMLPGFYKKRKLEVEEIEENEEDFDDSQDVVFGEEDEETDDDIEYDAVQVGTKNKNAINGDFEDWDPDMEDDDSDDLDLDGLGPAGVGYGNITEETIEKTKKKRLSKSERKKLAREAARVKEEVTVCARCHSLRNYGQVKHEMAENLIPDFDFDRLVTTRLVKPTGNPTATVVVMVVDCVDFDGSFPRQAARSLFKTLEGSKDSFKLHKQLPRLVLVGTKVDLLPSQISPTRLDRWVRHRAKANGAPKLSGVYLVSARKDLGVRNLLSFIKELAGPRGHVWVIGAQNAGKSTLINAFAKKEGVKVTKLTEAAVPGTTLGILRIQGILSAKAKMYDTPGLLHSYLLSMRLSREEQKMVEIRKELQPRSYRVKTGQTIHVGGLVRIDVTDSSVDTIYITIFASPNVSLHLGKTENAEDIKDNHVGIRLQPPVSVDRVLELGQWTKKEIEASGTSWEVNSIDIAVAGFGWFSLGLKGEAKLAVWTYDGIDISLREPLVLDRAPFLERPGFWLPKAISEAIGNQSKLEAQLRECKGIFKNRLEVLIPSDSMTEDYVQKTAFVTHHGRLEFKVMPFEI